MLSIISFIASFIASIATFLVWVFVGQYLNTLTHHRFSRLWLDVTVVGGLVSGLIVLGIVKNLIYKEPTHFR